MLAQSRQVFANIREVLSAAGAAMSDVVKITAFITDVDRYNEYKTARTEAFPAAIPASSTVTSPVLVLPEMLVEVEAVAVVSA